MTFSDGRGAQAKTTRKSMHVAERALAMCALVCRGSIENGTGDPDAELLYGRILDWLTRINVWSLLEPVEQRILHAPLGQLGSADLIRATWTVEGLAVMAWALNRLDSLPNHDQKVDLYGVTDSLLFLGEDAFAIVTNATLRSSIELEAYRELMYAVHCRLRDFARNRGREKFRNWIDDAWIRTLRADATHLTVDDDLAIDKTVLAEVGNDRLDECEWIASARRRAIGWILGEDPIYSHVRVDT